MDCADLFVYFTNKIVERKGFIKNYRILFIIHFNDENIFSFTLLYYFCVLYM